MKVTSGILGLPQELLGNVLSFLYPQEIATFGQTCRTAHAFIDASNQTLWRSSFLHVFDDPSKAWSALNPTVRAANAAYEVNWNWHTQLCRRFMALKAVTTSDKEYQRLHHSDGVSALIDVLETANRASLSDEISLDSHTSAGVSLNIAFLERAFSDELHASGFIHDFPIIGPSSTSSRPITRLLALNQRQAVPELVSRLHIYYGLTNRERSSRKTKGVARRLTYDWQSTGPESDYGPFKRDGSGCINWQILEAIYTVIGLNFELAADTGDITVPHGFRYSTPHLYPSPSLHPQDWARVTGPWLGTYSFLDYADLFYFNTGYRPGPQPALDDFEEAHGELMRLELELDDSHALRDDWRLQTDLPICEDLPVLFFSGTSGAHGGAHAPPITVKGRVSLVPQGREVRWRFIVSYMGSDQWQLEGVQPGGVRSGGVFGTWSQCDHEDRGPIGPFCYYPQELCRERVSSVARETRSGW